MTTRSLAYFASPGFGRRTTALALLLLGLLGFSAGCQSDQTPTSSPSVVDVGSDPEDNNPSLWSLSIGPSGGTVQGANADFTVPPDALASSVVITMAYNASLGNEVVMGPSGQQFAEACTLTMDKPSGYDPEDTYHIFLWDPSETAWEDLGGTDHGATVSATISHFSRYKVDILD